MSGGVCHFDSSSRAISYEWRASWKLSGNGVWGSPRGNDKWAQSFVSFEGFMPKPRSDLGQTTAQLLAKPR